MPRFFFDFRDGGYSRGFDSEGLELVDAEHAKREAMVAVSQVMQLEAPSDDRRVVECCVRSGVPKSTAFPSGTKAFGRIRKRNSFNSGRCINFEGSRFRFRSIILSKFFAVCRYTASTNVQPKLEVFRLLFENIAI